MEFNLIDYNNIMNKDHVILYYKGPFDANILSQIGTYLRNKFRDNPRIASKLFAIFVELAQNIAHYSAEKNFFPGGQPEAGGIGMLVVYEEEDAYVLSAGNLIKRDNLEPIIEKIDRINTLDHEGLRAFKREIRRHERDESHVGGSTGLIQVAIKSGQPLKVETQTIDDDSAFFMISTRLLKTMID